MQNEIIEHLKSKGHTVDFTINRTRVFKKTYLTDGWIYLIINVKFKGRTMQAGQRIKGASIEAESQLVLKLRETIKTKYGC